MGSAASDIRTQAVINVAALTPTTVTGRRFKQAPGKEPLANLGKDTSFDRAFRVVWAGALANRKFYGVSTVEVQQTLVVEIGHLGKQNDIEIEDRRDQDTEAIFKALQMYGQTWPASLLNITLAGTSTTDVGAASGANATLTEIRFLVTYEVT